MKENKTSGVKFLATATLDFSDLEKDLKRAETRTWYFVEASYFQRRWMGVKHVTCVSKVEIRSNGELLGQ